MSTVSTKIVIEAPPSAVWAVVMDPGRLREWVTIHRKLGKVYSGAPREGSQMQQTLCLRGANFRVDWTLAKCQEPSRALWEGKGPARSRASTEYRLSEHSRGTCFDYRNEFKAPLGPLGALASRALVGGIPEREANRSLERLKTLVENS
ncbi:MAG TPA: SRPBCC family protein [Solirubrobacteraceae bacterium]|jgi:carbon monoxide dehydrogenase subunit G|nr:SRPBCC family protein [Solirubrobacteraceae bacterium]